MTLLYHTAYWHALAKMRMHTDRTLALLSHSTTILGRALRHFTAVTCHAFDTKESKSEYDARKRAQARRRTATTAPITASGRRRRVFNLKVVKLHFLGDYVWSIKRFGTTDSYTTQIVSGPSTTEASADCGLLGRARASSHQGSKEAHKLCSS